MNSSKTTARVIGALFLAAFIMYGAGTGLVESVSGTSDYLENISASKIQFSIGAILMLVNSAVVAGIGILIFPILKQHNEPIALTYLGTRIIESVILIVGVISLLSLIPLSQEYINSGISDSSYFLTLGALAKKGNYFAYQIAMIVLGTGSLFFCYLLYQSILIPRFLSVWGFIGYAVFLTGALLEIFGFTVGLLLSIPGGLFEIFLGIWLIVKGFNSEF